MEYSAILAIMASVFYGAQAMTVEYGINKFKTIKNTSPSFLAAFISIVISVIIFWILLLVRGVNLNEIKIVNLWPFILAGTLNPAIFRLLYFKSIDKVGAGISSAIVAANPAIATIIAIALLGEKLTIFTLVGIILIVIGGSLIQLLRNTENEKNDDLILNRLKETDVNKIHMAIASPPVKHPCFYGLDTSRRRELVAREKEVEEIAEYIGADSLNYLSLRGLLSVLKADGYGYCSACFNGSYPTEEKTKREVDKNGFVL